MSSTNNNKALAVVTVCGVRGYLDDNGTAHINLEDTARGLGFTQIKNGVEYVRRDRVSQYLNDFCFPTSGESDDLPEFIPENIFYKLCFKANNRVAREFQDTVTDEVLPSIRKHGMYATSDKIEELLADPDTLIITLQTLKAEREARKALEAKVEKDAPKVLFADAVHGSGATIPVGDMAKILKQNGVNIGRTRFFSQLREDGYLVKHAGRSRNMPTQKSMELGLFEIRESAIVHSDGETQIHKTPLITGKGQAYFVQRYANPSAT